ncbi:MULTISPECIES: sugar ABC transporter ATP-binding protein [Streptomyces]|uniref:Sugar ABC transporter ATP-binding protein n=1 Tax=Streptomyces odorifer TaxID=53450 RepID=A0A7Y6C4Q4_9ACTN|nr:MULTISPECIES: sugar ABC transporter ATP-binding protein [Streptomyces]NUV33526.1 sugar ABC transporter ATP-binding protein [Streptomyces sp. KAI-27]NUV45623.1 sugar ABC transporter ATP-binding protein [Streptomyces sp. CAI-78]MBL0778137.1 sugar ABC transporter ATP-binding protein [Streptomyces albidoflavus]MBV1957316.1 sugar ABC transporter ATP-binding protein [Streptomyces sp. BV333]MCG5123049.1 sugar ABC transporter ATP-binding protein [Streptomyces sp. T7(2022)]
MSNPDELLRIENIRKTFPGVVALDSVDFDLRRGEVHVLLGENGAGKSTLIKMLSGAYRPDSGTLYAEGREVRIQSAQDAERLGIATIYQEFNLVPDLTVAENIFLGRQPRRFGLIDRKKMEADAEELLARVGVQVSPRARVRDLGIARLQMVEIAKALSLDARVLIMDEPTAVLTSEEVEKLFVIVRQLRADGVGIVFITHHLEEIAALGDRVTVLRDGRSVEQVPASTPEDELVRLMVGRSIDQQYPREHPEQGEPLLTVRGLTRDGVFQDVGFEVRAGEIVGLAGLVGAGRTEVARAVFGADPYDRGSVEVLGRELPRHDVNAAMTAGLGLVPEDRKGQGLVLDASVQENLGLVTLKAASRGGLVDLKGQRTAAARIAEQLGVRMAGLGQHVRTLSGGNQQKVVIGKWLLADTKVLILDEPTRGIDVGAKVEIYQLMNELTASGHAVLMISSDLPEVLGMSDRVLVMAQGRVAGELAGDAATQDAVMALAVTTPPSNDPAVKEVEAPRGH